MSTCIHLYPPQNPFWERFRLENYDFVGSDQSVHIVIVHIVVNSPPATYQLKLRHEFLLCGPPTMIAVISEYSEYSEYSDYSHHSDHFAPSIYAYHPSYLRFCLVKDTKSPLPMQALRHIYFCSIVRVFFCGMPCHLVSSVVSRQLKNHGILPHPVAPQKKGLLYIYNYIRIYNIV